MAPVLWASTTFEIDTLADGRRMAHSSRAAEFYSRHGNPTINAFEDAVAELEGAEAAISIDQQGDIEPLVGGGIAWRPHQDDR